MGDTPEAVIQKKYAIELKRTSKGVWYIHSLSINADTKEEFEQAIDEAKEIANRKFADIQEMGDRMMLERGKKKPKKERKPVEPIQLNQEDLKLLEKLKTRRKELADKKGFPAYVIAHNRLLELFASKKPKTKEEMLLVGGMGEKRFGDYGEIFLREIIDYCEN